MIKKTCFIVFAFIFCFFKLSKPVSARTITETSLVGCETYNKTISLSSETRIDTYQKCTFETTWKYDNGKTRKYSFTKTKRINSQITNFSWNVYYLNGNRKSRIEFIFDPGKFIFTWKIFF